MKTKTRKVIQFGNEELVITLPRDFTIKMGIKKGDTVGICYDQTITIVPAPKP